MGSIPESGRANHHGREFEWTGNTYIGCYTEPGDWTMKYAKVKALRNQFAPNSRG